MHKLLFISDVRVYNPTPCVKHKFLNIFIGGAKDSKKELSNNRNMYSFWPYRKGDSMRISEGWEEYPTSPQVHAGQSKVEDPDCADF
jgi:hypothetical protein